jgi:hypothetical protein
MCSSKGRSMWLSAISHQLSAISRELTADS